MTEHSAGAHEPAVPMPISVLHETADRLDPHPESSHTDHSLTYVVDGWLQMENRGRIRVSAGTVTAVPPGIPHQLLGGRGVDLWLVTFCAPCLQLDESHPLMSAFRYVRQGAFPTMDVARSRRGHVVRLFTELQDELQLQKPESPEIKRSLLVLLLGEVRRASPSAETAVHEGSLVSSVLEFVQQHALEPISLKDVAASVHRSPTYVASEVKASTGHTVGEWIVAGRIAEAAARLAHTDDTIDQIVGHVGWNDKTHFIRQFRKARGITPAAWRREHRRNHPTSTGPSA